MPPLREWQRGREREIEERHPTLSAERALARTSNMISATAWIRKGAAAQTPLRVEMTEEQYKAIMERAKAEIGDAKVALAEAKAAAAATAEGNAALGASPTGDAPIEDDLARFNLDAYSDDDGAKDGASQEDADLGMEAFTAIDEDVLDGHDPYLEGGEAAEEDPDDIDDLTIRPTDNMVVACRTEDEVSYLEVYVYEEEEEGNLYVHHDVMLPSFPLCIEWLGIDLSHVEQTSALATPGDSPSRPSASTNYVAVGTFEPEIEIWNLDVLEAPYPTMILGEARGPTASPSAAAAPPKGKGRPSEAHHTDAVMSLSWNRMQANLLLSGSADTTVKLWDVSSGKALRSFNHHSGKVQTLHWSPLRATVLASAAYDRKLIAFDCRTREACHTFSLLADPECVRWSPHDEHVVAVSDEEGRILAFDVRAAPGGAALWRLEAHGKAVSAIDWNPTLRGCLLSASADKSVKVWNVAGNAPVCLAARNLSLGKIFSASFSPDSPGLICAAGSKGILSVVNVFQDEALLATFAEAPAP